MKVKSESEVAQSCATLHDPMDSSSVHGIFQARVLEWGAIALCLWSPNYKALLRRIENGDSPDGCRPDKRFDKLKVLGTEEKTAQFSERVTGRKARGLQMEEIAYKCQTFLSLLSGRRKQTSNIFFLLFTNLKRGFS